VRRTLTLICACLCLAAGSQADRRESRLPFSSTDADRFDAKWAAVVARKPAPPSRRRRNAIHTVITEPEVNAYLRFRASADLPVGVVDPYVFAQGAGRLSVVATVDLDAVRLSRARDWLDVARLLRGRVPVTATGVLRSQDGVFRVELESATAAGFAIPKPLLQELVTFYSRTASNPRGFELDAPFVLPGGIRDILVRPGQALIVQ
jgi:hypothetical protein